MVKQATKRNFLLLSSTCVPWQLGPSIAKYSKAVGDGGGGWGVSFSCASVMCCLGGFISLRSPG